MERSLRLATPNLSGQGGWIAWLSMPPTALPCYRRGALQLFYGVFGYVKVDKGSVVALGEVSSYGHDDRS
jgi:hypothetical protein